MHHCSVVDVGGQADVYLEGIDQFKGWFQTSLLTKVAVDETAPYRSVSNVLKSSLLT